MSLLVALALSAAPAAGEIRFTSDDAKNQVPDRYRLAPHTFAYTLTPKYHLAQSGVIVETVTFPSPITTPHAANNTVVAEYFRPKAPGKYPAVIVLDILDGAGIVSRGEAIWLATHDICALVVTMPYYGPRRPPNSKLRLLSTDVTASLDNVRQTVLDGRRAVAWLGDRPEVDADRLGVLGTSLGSFLGGLLAAAEPRIHSACLMLGGGGLVDAFYDHPQAGLAMAALRLIGIGKGPLKTLIAPADPITFADRLKEKRLLLIAASRDDVVPPSAMTRLWDATGQPPILWYDATHVGMAFYTFPAMAAVVDHLKR